MACSQSMRTVHSVLRLVFVLSSLAQDALRFLLLGTRSGAAIKAENMFLRKQLALYLEREVKPRRATDATRLSLVLLSRLFAWQDALVNVKPETFLGWHRKAFQLLWRWKSRPRGRPRVPGRLQELIFKMAHENPMWGEERIAAELLLKLGIRVSPRTVRRYMPLNNGPTETPSFSAMDDVCTKSRPGDVSQRFLCRRDGSLSSSLPVCNHGGRNTQDCSLQRDRSSYRSLDDPAVSRGHHG